MYLLLFLSSLLSIGFTQQHCAADASIGCTAGSSCTTVRKCPQYTDGYSSGEVWKYSCINGAWDHITCNQLAPANFKYPSSVVETAINQPLTPIIPTVECYQCKFKVHDSYNLPPGIEFQVTDGTISGTPTSLGSWTVKIIARAEDAAADATFEITITVHSHCAAADGWPQTAAGTEVEKKCEGDTVGSQTRFCKMNGTWDSPDIQACLPGNPKSDMIYVDMILYLANGNTEEIKREKGIGIVSGLLNFYTALDYDSLSVHYIRTVGNYTSIQIRLTTIEETGETIYYDIKRTKTSGHVLANLDDYITANKKNYLATTTAEFTLHSIDKYVSTEVPKETISLNTIVIVVSLIITIIVVIVCTIVIICALKKQNERIMRIRKPALI